MITVIHALRWTVSAETAAVILNKLIWVNDWTVKLFSH